MSTKKIVYGGIFAALVMVTTWVIKIPIPTGYIHTGDAMVYLSGALLGPLGALSAGLGSLLSDLVSGYAHYALPTFVIKAMDALVVALLFKQLQRAGDSQASEMAKFAASALLGGIVMVGGYFAYETIVYPELALASVPFNVTQAVGGIVVATVVYPILKRFKLDLK